MPTLYTTGEECHDFCALLPHAETGVAFTNSVACRTLQATDGENPTASCAAAAPGGGDVCGKTCETYCEIFAKLCAGYCHDNPNTCLESDPDCVRRCGGLRVDGATRALPGGTYDKDDNYDLDDSLQCRVRHLVAAVSKPELHCGHAAFVPTAHCSDPDDQAPSCDDFCKLTVEGACVGPFQVYENETQCVKVCDAMAQAGHQGKNGDTRVVGSPTDTVGCRWNHAHFALLHPETHCPHIGPGGESVCGDNCEFFCLLKAQACGGSELPADCQASCSNIPNPEKFTLAAAKKGGNTLECRLLHVMRALEKPQTAADECPVVNGDKACSAN
jgi:hypothetical protein